MPSDPPTFALPVSADTIRPLVAVVVAEMLDLAEKDRKQVPETRLAYTEDEAASLIGLNSHQLRDERKRGRIAHTRIVKDGVRYEPSDLRAYLRKNRTEAAA